MGLSLRSSWYCFARFSNSVFETVRTCRNPSWNCLYFCAGVVSVSSLDFMRPIITLSLAERNSMMREVLYVFLCKNCGKPIRLQAQTLGHRFQVPTSQATDVDSVGAVCFHCKHVANYSMHKNSPDYRREYRSAVAIPVRETVYVKQLKCDEENCKTPLHIYAQWNESTTDKEREAEIGTWKLVADLHCPNFHAIRG